MTRIHGGGTKSTQGNKRNYRSNPQIIHNAKPQEGRKDEERRGRMNDAPLGLFCTTQSCSSRRAGGCCVCIHRSFMVRLWILVIVYFVFVFLCLSLCSVLISQSTLVAGLSVWWDRNDPRALFSLHLALWARTRRNIVTHPSTHHRQKRHADRLRRQPSQTQQAHRRCHLCRRRRRRLWLFFCSCYVSFLYASSSTMSDSQSASDDLSGLGGFFFYVFIIHPCTAWILRPGRFERKKSIMYAIAFLAGVAAIKSGMCVVLVTMHLMHPDRCDFPSLFIPIPSFDFLTWCRVVSSVDVSDAPADRFCRPCPSSQRHRHMSNTLENRV